MKRTVNDTLFWKDRIEMSKVNGKEHYSVYLCNPSAWHLIEREHKNIVEDLLGGKVLDAGCGYGRASEWLPGEYTGVDFSPDFIEIAKKKYPDKKFVLASLKYLPFKKKEFDWAVCISIKHMIQSYTGNEEWEPMEAELKRVAKKVLILEYTDPEIYEVLE